MEPDDNQLYRSVTINGLRRLDGEQVFLMRGNGYGSQDVSKGWDLEQPADVSGTLRINGDMKPRAYVDSHRGSTEVRPGDSLVHGDDGFNVVRDTRRMRSSLRIMMEYHNEALECSTCFRRMSASVLLLPTFFYVAVTGDRPKECGGFEYCDHETDDPCDYAFSIPMVLEPAMKDDNIMEKGALLTTLFPSLMEAGMIADAAKNGLKRVYYTGYDDHSKLVSAKVIEDAGVEMFRVEDDDVNRLLLPDSVRESIEAPPSFPKCGISHTARDKSMTYMINRLKVKSPMKFRHFHGNGFLM